MKYSNYILALLASTLLWCCKKDNYPGGNISPFIAIYDLRNLYKGEDVTLNLNNMFGSGNITGIVVSDHSGGNLPDGWLMIQDNRRLSQLRGITIPLGAAAANYKTGDSLIINVEGAVLTKVNGMLHLNNITEDRITKAASGRTIQPNRVPISAILANPANYEATLTVIVKGGYSPLPQPGDLIAGDKTLNDGFGNIILHTDAKANFSGQEVAVLANYFTVVINHEDAAGKLIPQLHLRTGDDVVLLSSVVEVAPIVITGFLNDPLGTDSNYEYIQFLAVKDIDFTATPYSVVTTNNAGASTPAGIPTNGWATGDLRTYKLDITSGTVAKGTYFYVGGSLRTINGGGSTVIPESKWVKGFNYSHPTTGAGNGFGKRTTNLLANSGNAFGMAIFDGTIVTASSKPVDVMFVSTGGTLFSAAPLAGYRIANTDFYDVINPINLTEQPFYRQGSNTLALPYQTGAQGQFYKLGGEYNPSLGRWTKARSQLFQPLTATSALAEIEEGEGVTKLAE